MSFNLNTLSDKTIVVIGDVMLDQYTWGNVSRISPEAPVPVVRVNNKTKVIGGAANVASNLSGLGCRVVLIGLKGDDAIGNDLESICVENAIDTVLVTDPSRPTTIKTRIMASKQQLFRLDEEETHLMDDETSTRFMRSIEKKIPEADVVILSDYGKGTLATPGICHQIIQLCADRSIPCLVDPKGQDWERYAGATCITPNTLELQAITGTTHDIDNSRLSAELAEIKNRFNLNCLLLTRGAKGMCVADDGETPLFIPTKAREVFDVSGAGDTVIATFAAGISAGLSFRNAAELANTAAGIVVGKVGTQPVSATELEQAMKTEDNASEITGYFKADSIENSKDQIKAWQSSGDTVVFTNGCFDLLHPGHVDLLYKAKSLGNRLIVGLNSDKSVKRLKGETRPILAEKDRAAILSALACVDLVVLFDEDTPLELLEALKPDILVKGADYKIEDVVGRDLVEYYGGKVCLVELVEGYSTSKIEKKIIDTNKLNR